MFDYSKYELSLITGENVEGFLNVLTLDLAEEIRVGLVLGIGMLYKEGEKYKAVASMVCESDTVSNYTMIRCKWLYVHENYRNNSICKIMLKAIYSFSKDKGFDAVTVDFYENENADEIEQMLLRWGYHIVKGYHREVIVKLTNVKGISYLITLSKNVNSFLQLDPNSRQRIIQRVLYKDDRNEKLLKRSFPKDYFLPSLSGYIGDVSNPSAMILAHCTPMGKLRAEYLYYDEDKQNDGLNLLAFFTANAIKEAIPDYDRLVFYPNTFEEQQLLDNMFELQLSAKLREGIRYVR